MAPPNGSRLSCGSPARRRKSSGPQSVPRQRHNTPIPLERSPPVSFKRLLGRRRTQARRCKPFVTASTAASAKSSTAPTAARTVCSKRNRAGRRCGSRPERDEREGRGGNGGVPAPTAVGGRRAGGTSSASSCVCRSNSSSLPESLFSTGPLVLPGCLFFSGFFPFLIAHARPNGSRLSCGRPARRRKGGGRQSVPRQGHNTPLPLKRSPPGSFKRLLGSIPVARPSVSAIAEPARFQHGRKSAPQRHHTRSR